MIFNINFFLFSFAQVFITCYTFVYAKYYANVSNVQFGTFAMILPTLALFAKPVVCSIADSRSCHRQMLISFLMLFGVSYGSLAIIPFIKNRENHETDSIAWLIIGSLMAVGYVACACIFCMNDALASNYARKHNLSYGGMRIYSNVGWGSGAVVGMVFGDVDWLPPRVLGLSLLAATILIDVIVLLLWPYQEDFEMFHDGSTIEQRKLSIVGPNTLALAATRKPRGSISKDMLDRIRAGRSKSMGNLPQTAHANHNGQFTILSAASLVNSIKVPPGEQPEPQKEYTNFQCQMILMKMIAGAHKSFIRFIWLFIVYGIIQGIVWNFQLDYLRDSVARSDSDFEFISALCMISQTIFGDIPINAAAAHMIRLFGTNAILSLALISIGLRCFLYTNIVPFAGKGALVLAEAMQGPSLTLYWILIVEVGSNYALMVTDFMPELKRRGIVRDIKHEEELSGCLRATMIGVMSSSMEGLGVALGSLLGGFMSTSIGYDNMWNLCAGLGFVVGFANIGWDLVRKLLIPSISSSSDQKVDNKLNLNIRGQNHIPVVVIEAPPSPATPKSTKM